MSEYCKNCEVLQQENEKLKEELKSRTLAKCPNCNEEYLNYRGCELYEELQAEREKVKELKKKLGTFVKDDKWVHPEVLALKKHQFCEGMGRDCLEGTVECQQKECRVRDFPKYKQALAEIEEKIKEIGKKEILTFPDFSLQENAKIIMGQCNDGYKTILDIISKAKGKINEKNNRENLL